MRKKISVEDRFMRLPEVAKMAGVSNGTIYNWMNAGTFSKSLSLGPQIVVWLASDVEKWMQEKIEKRD